MMVQQGFSQQLQFLPGDSIESMKQAMGQQFNMPSDHIRLSFRDVVLRDEELVGTYRENDTAVVELSMEIVDPNESAYAMPDIIEVNLGPAVGDEDGPDQIVLVKVVRDNLNREKPFLGGYKHKIENCTYHHAESQTYRKRKVKGVEKLHREMQTVTTETRSQQTTREMGTQMDRPDLYNDHSADKLLLARKAITSEELQEKRNVKAKEIQCFLRQCFAWRRVRRLREARYEVEYQATEEADETERQNAVEHRRQIERRMHPRTASDFAVLHSELEAWRLHETQRIKNSALPKDEIHFQLEELLGKEVKLLQTIDRLKITATHENKQTRTKETLEKMASPKEWTTSEGDLVEVETPFTTRAKELVELYNGLCLHELPKLQRVDVLLHVKYTVKEFDCDLTRDIVELIEREEDLIRRGRSEKSLEKLRLRLSNLMLQFIDTPEFNPASIIV
jgi:hypothetical protein